MKFLAMALMLVLALLQYRLWVGEGSIAEVRQLQMQVAEQLASNAGLQARNEALETEVLSLKEGLEAIEERARSELGMIRDDETFYLVIE